MADPLLDPLFDWLRIPSVSAGGSRPEDLRRAAEWVLERVEAAGGEARMVETAGNPIAYGELRARDPQAPTVIVYGHYDVQSPGDLAEWRTDPFEPELRDGRIWARGASDDKGNSWPVLHAALELARAGELPVNVRVLFEGEEEVGSAGVQQWLREDERGADAAIVFDSDMTPGADGTPMPALCLGLRGVVFLDLEVRTGRRDLHSGLFGGSVLNAAHVVHRMLAQVVPSADGELREELRAGVREPDRAEIESWARLLPGDRVIAAAGGRPATPDAGARFYEQVWGGPSLTVNHLAAGEPRTVVPSVARATVSLRLAPGQTVAEVRPALVGLLREALPEGAELTVSGHTAEPALFEPAEPALRLAAQALERAAGAPVALVRSGGSIPIVGGLAERGIPAIVSGFALPDDEIHAPNESYRLDSLRLGERAGRELLHALAGLRR